MLLLFKSNFNIISAFFSFSLFTIIIYRCFFSLSLKINNKLKTLFKKMSKGRPTLISHRWRNEKTKWITYKYNHKKKFQNKKVFKTSDKISLRVSSMIIIIILRQFLDLKLCWWISLVVDGDDDDLKSIIIIFFCIVFLNNLIIWGQKKTL